MDRNGQSSTVPESKVPLNMPLNRLKAPIAVDPPRGTSGPSILCHSSVGWPGFCRPLHQTHTHGPHKTILSATVANFGRSWLAPCGHDHVSLTHEDVKVDSVGMTVLTEWMMS
jgi:hypothetical protein